MRQFAHPFQMVFGGAVVEHSSITRIWRQPQYGGWPVFWFKSSRPVPQTQLMQWVNNEVANNVTG